MVTKDHPELSITKQCELLGVSRSTYYHEPRGESAYNQELMQKIDRQYMKTPFYGSRQMKRHLVNQGYRVGRGRVRRLMQKMGIEAVYQKPRTSRPNPDHKVYPYLLRGLDIHEPNQAWCSDITYIPMKRGFLYLVSIMDWHSRAVLSYRLSNRLDADFCVSALEEALRNYGVPEFFNTDQGAQFTSRAFIETLEMSGTRISMDGKGRWMDNVFIERLWRSCKYECVYLQEFETVSQAKNAISGWISFYNWDRPHSVFDGRRPMEVYLKNAPEGFGHSQSPLPNQHAA
jgi:putative transposase